MKNNEIEFLKQSNLIEGVSESKYLDDAVDAWEYTKKLDLDDINAGEILEIHKILIKRFNPAIAGRYRNIAVQIGGRICKNVGSVELHKQINAWCKEINKSVVYLLNSKSEASKYKLEKKCKDDHITFESIHPFRDGNGRIGRILYNRQRLAYDLPVHIVKEKERFEYYKWFEQNQVLDFINIMNEVQSKANKG